MSEKLAWFPFYVRDWMTDEKVMTMTFEERGIYLQLLCIQWLEGSLSNATAMLERCLGIESGNAALARVLETSFVAHPTEKHRLANPRLLQVAWDQEVAHEKRVNAGSKGGASKARAMLKQRSSIQNQKENKSSVGTQNVPTGGAAKRPRRPSPKPLNGDSSHANGNGASDWLQAFLGPYRASVGEIEASRLARCVSPCRSAIGHDGAVAAFGLFVQSPDIRFKVEYFREQWQRYNVPALIDGQPNPAALAILGVRL